MLAYLIKIQCLDGLNPEYLNYHLNSHIAKQYCYEVKSAWRKSIKY